MRMKKTMAVLLTAILVCGALSAQDAPAKKWKFGFSTNVLVDALRGDSTWVDYTGRPDTVEPQTRNRFVVFPIVTDPSGTDTSFLAGDSRLRVTFNYDGDIFHAYLRANVDSFLHGIAAGSFWSNAAGPSVTDILNASFDEYRVTAKANDIFSFEISNTAKRGVFQDYRYAIGDFYDDQADAPNTFVNFGVLTTTNGTTASTADVLDLRQSARITPPTTITQNDPTTGILANIKFGSLPITLSLHGGANITDAITNDWETAGNVGARVETAKLFNLLSLAGVYKLTFQDNTAAGQPDDTNPGAVKGDSDGNGLANHAFGLYANVGLLNDALGISFGYSGIIRADEAEKIGENTINTYNPLFSGFTVAARYSGLEIAGRALTLTTNNNVSFGIVSVPEADRFDPYKIYTGLGGGTLTDYATQAELVLNDAVSAQYQFSDKMAFVAEVSNSWLSYTWKNEAPGVKTESATNTNISRLNLGVSYAFSDNVRVTCGFVIQNTNTAVSQSALGSADYTSNTNTLTYGVPIGVKVNF
ncbi:hypothetical protein FACS189483_05700 [Spirochaetia bacterium]|nr:hypothetical protein FACS189483_05700 [Spirochaetia bacterium]